SFDSFAKLSGRAETSTKFRCPIPNCTKVFVGSRGGWAGHVGTFRMHPDWEPYVKEHGDRLRVFRARYPEFFGVGRGTHRDQDGTEPDVIPEFIPTEIARRRNSKNGGA